MKKMAAIPVPVLKRLTRYLVCIEDFCAADRAWVSSRELADALGLTGSTVRQDLSHLDFCGMPKRGYRTEHFRTVLSSVLASDRSWKMVLVGAGNMGCALAHHKDFRRPGFGIVGVFDSDAAKVGKRLDSLTVLPMKNLRVFVANERIDIGIIAVPGPAAQGVADLLVAAGIRGIFNLSGWHVACRPEVPSIDVRISIRLMELTHMISMSDVKQGM